MTGPCRLSSVYHGAQLHIWEEGDDGGLKSVVADDGIDYLNCDEKIRIVLL